jgi:hypothetical protein
MPGVPVAKPAPSVPSSNISRDLWIGAAIGCLFGCLFGMGGGLGIAKIFNVGTITPATPAAAITNPTTTLPESPLATKIPQPEQKPAPVQPKETAVAAIVGRWEILTASVFPFGSSERTAEFRKDQTGRFVSKVPKWTPTDKEILVMDDFKWSITQEEKPVLIIEHLTKDKERRRTHLHFAREGDTLTLTALAPSPFYPSGALVLRRLP